jgi:alginate O-acetyltransferase complex protein AlgI
MRPIHIAGVFVLSIIYRWLLPARWRQWFLLVASVVGIYWFQFLWVGLAEPRVAIYPTITLGLILGVWWLIRPDEADHQRENRVTFLITLLVALGIVVFLDWLRYGPPHLRIFELKRGAALLVTAAAIIVGSRRWHWTKQTFLLLTTIGILTIIGLFVLFKQHTLNTLLFALLARLTGSSELPASQWIGFSYVAFRLIHVLRDTQTGKVQNLTLRQYLTYVIFYPAYLSGPIDRVERFNQDHKALSVNKELPASQIIDGGSRVMIGMFKKFVIADTLAFFALSPYSIQAGEQSARRDQIT